MEDLRQWASDNPGGTITFGVESFRHLFRWNPNDLREFHRLVLLDEPCGQSCIGTIYSSAGGIHLHVE
jgi:hypothetical protein